ncbi:endonuclease/exonuclease/phosphatase family protein [Salinactinospora qingdaonensis]|uniref:Endonuclease/exonuclease/phosphatase family protein n=1 Tax=Salinactinospora qingdaonensis TaxID=702744 RepID=A0ABP7GIF5_9ACTN
MSQSSPSGGGLIRRRRSVLAAVVVLPWAVWAVIRWFGLETGYPLVPALAFTPYVAATAIVPVAVALLLRRWGAAAVAVAVAASLVVAVLPRAVAAPQPDPAPTGPQLRVMTINLYFGEADPGTVVELVRQTHIDVLSVQELTPEAVADLDQAGLGETLGYALLEERSGAAGGGIYSRYPLTSVGGSTAQHFAMPRAALRVPGAAPLEVVSAHPVPPTGPVTVDEWEESLAALPEATPEATARILAGDFNATLDHGHLRDLIASGYVDAAGAAGRGWSPTWPQDGGLPGVTIDHILVDSRVKVDETRVYPLPGTDHRAVHAELTLPGT